MAVWKTADMIAVSDCEICSHLAEVETSYAKYGWEDHTRPLPPQAGRLTPVGDPGALNPEHHVRRCPLCGTLYRYDWSYEYLVNGSEDEEVLTRLTPDEARAWLTEAEYAALVACLPVWAAHPDAQTRHYAGKCLAAHWLACQDLAALRALLRHHDTRVAEGAVAHLARLTGEGPPSAALRQLQSVFAALGASAEGELAERARWLAARLGR